MFVENTHVLAKILNFEGSDFIMNSNLIRIVKYFVLLLVLLSILFK